MILTIPLWAPLGLLAAFLGFTTARAIRRRRWTGCRGCRYDLSGVPLDEGGTVTCPECGAPDAVRRA